jgi:Zn-dependent peptidase ImmA (M78 family)
MSRSPLAEINCQILRWARETAGLDIEDAASKIGTSPGRLEAWESGDSYPTVKRLRQLAKAYMRPIGLFFLSELPDEPERIRDFRKLAEVPEEEMSSALRFEIRLAAERRDEAMELASDLGEESKKIAYPVNLRDDPDQVALRLRNQLAVSTSQQASWATKWEAFSSWRSAVESLGILVFQTGVFRNLIVDPMEARGFSISEQPFPVIVVNGKDHASAKCFTLIHELVHVLLHEGGICDLHDPFTVSSHSDRAEVFCNRVAGALLVPAEAIMSDEVVRRHGDDPVWSDIELGQLSRKFWVSWEVVLRRLLILGRTTREYYQDWRERSRDRFPGHDDGSENPRIPTHTRVVIRNGKLFPTLVLRALRENIITMYEASDMLQAGPDRLMDIENAVH